MSSVQRRQIQQRLTKRDEDGRSSRENFVIITSLSAVYGMYWTAFVRLTDVFESFLHG